MKNNKGLGATLLTSEYLWRAMVTVGEGHPLKSMKRERHLQKVINFIYLRHPT